MTLTDKQRAILERMRGGDTIEIMPAFSKGFFDNGESVHIRTINRLEREGYIKRAGNATFTKPFMVITPAGRKAMEEAQ